MRIRTSRGLCLLVAIAFPFWSVAAQEALDPPPAGKAVVYIGKMNSLVGGAYPMHFFANDQYVGRIKGKKYVRVVVDPGEQLFWVAMQARRTFVKAQVEAGHSYALYAKLENGAELLPITRESDYWKEFGRMLEKDEPFEYPQKDIEKWRSGRPDYIDKALAEWKAAGEPALKLLADEYVD
jgi:hypothetical protein